MENLVSTFINHIKTALDYRLVLFKLLFLKASLKKTLNSKLKQSDNLLTILQLKF